MKIWFSLILFCSMLPANHYDYVYKTDASKHFYEGSAEEFEAKKQAAYYDAALWGIVPSFLGIFGYYVYKNRMAKTPVVPNPQGAVGQALPFAAVGAIGFFWSQFFARIAETTFDPHLITLQQQISGFLESCIRSVVGIQEDELHNLELKYLDLKSHIPKDTQRIIEENFFKIRTHYVIRSRYDTSDVKENPVLTQTRSLLSLPYKTKTLEWNQELFDTEFQQYCGLSNRKPISEFERFGLSLVRSSTLQNPRLKMVPYLHGPPGTGKTEAVSKLGRVLGIPVIKINLSEVSNIGDLKGIRCDYPEDSRCTPGLIARELIRLHQEGYDLDVIILFFDEADHVLNRIQEGQHHELVSFMLDFVEGKTKSFYNPYVGTHISTKHWGTVLAGNQILNNAALRTRLSPIELNQYTLDYRKKVGRERFLVETLKDYSNVLRLQNFTTEDLKKIDLFAEHSEEDDGFRTQIQNIERFVHQKSIGSESSRLSCN